MTGRIFNAPLGSWYICISSLPSQICRKNVHTTSRIKCYCGGCGASRTCWHVILVCHLTNFLFFGPSSVVFNFEIFPRITCGKSFASDFSYRVNFHIPGHKILRTPIAICSVHFFMCSVRYICISLAEQYEITICFSILFSFT